MTKPKFLIISATIIGLIVIGFLFSCTDADSSINNEVDNTDSSAFLQSLEDYSLNFVKENPPMPSSRGSWGRFWKSVKSDVGGYVYKDQHSNITSHSEASISTSRKTWKELKRQENLDKVQEALELNSSEKAAIVNKLDSLKNEYTRNPNNVGAIHNAAILYSILDGTYDAYTTDEIVESTEKAMKYLGFVIIRSFGKEDIEIIDNFVNEAIEGDDLSFFNKLRELYPNRSREIQALEYYVYTVQQYSDINIIRNYTDGFIATVNKGSINNDIKKSIEQNVSIAPASFELWTYIDKLESK